MKDEGMRRELTLEVVVGAFIMVVLFGLGYFTVVLSGNALLEKKYQLEVVFQNILGLREGDNVVVRGMPVGTVKRLQLEEDGVHVVAVFDTRVPVHEGYKARIVSTSVLGGRHMRIDTGPEDARLLAEGTVLAGEEAHDMMQDATEIIAEFKRALVDEHVIENLGSVSRQLKDIATRLGEGQGSLGRLLSKDETLYNDLVTSAASLKELTTRLESGTSSIGKLLANDTTLYDNFDKTVTSVRSITERIEAGEGLIGKLLSKDDSLYNDLAASAASLKDIASRLQEGRGALGKLMTGDDKLYEDLAASVASLRKITTRIEKGEGSVGRLVSDEGLYNQAELLVEELRATVDDYRETSPVVSFTSLFFGAF